MSKAFLAVLLVATAAPLLAQTCPDRNLGVALGAGDEAVYDHAIGFAFPFAGTTYTDVHVCTNGFLFLSNGGVPAPGGTDYTATQAEFASGSPRICALWCDLNLIAANGAQIYANSTASTCTITWDRAVNYGMTTEFQLQVQLQSSGEVSIFYSEGATNNGTFNYASGRGIVGCTPGGGVTLPAVRDLSVVGTSVDDTIFEEWTVQTTFDLPLQKLLLLPSTPGWTNIPTPLAGCATATAYGTGCISAQNSFFEVMPAAAVDLAGTTTTMLRMANEYVVTSGVGGAIVAPTGAAQVVANGDDVGQTVALASAMPVPGGTTTAITICSNGRIALSAVGNGNSFAPDIGNFLNFAETSVAAAWHDYNPALAGSGSILFEQAGGFAYVTWDNVYTYGTAIPDRFQYQFELATGNITVVYDTFGSAGPNYLIGYSRGGYSLRPEMSDLSAALVAGIQIADADVAGLTVAANGLPLIGNAAFAIETTNVPNVAPLGILLVGDTQTPPLDLSFLGMPGCRAYGNANLTSVTFSVTLPQGLGTVPLAIPTNPALVGTTLVMQSAALTLVTPSNLVASNGLRLEIGV